MKMIHGNATNTDKLSMMDDLQKSMKPSIITSLIIHYADFLVRMRSISAIWPTRSAIATL